VPRAAWHWGGDRSAANNTLRAPGNTPFYLYLPPIRGSAGGDCYFSITRGTRMEKSQNKKPIKCRDSVVQTHVSSFAQQGASQSGEPPQGAGIPSKPRDNEQPTQIKNSSLVAHSPKQDTLHKARSSGLSVQEAMTSKSAEVDPKVQKLPTAKPRLSVAARRKFKKAWAGQSGTRGSVQPGTETLPLISMGRKRPRSEGHTPKEQPPKKPRAPLEPGY
jgi:hypothetical protein